MSPQADLEARRQELPPRGDEATGARWATRAQRRSRWVRRTRALWRAARAMAPTLATAVLLVLLAIAYYVKQGYHSPAGYVTIGSNFADRIRLQGLAVNGGGYDGQFSYYIARQPGILVICARNVAACPLDDAPERSERILYPMTVRLLALGQPGLLPYAMLLVNFVAILLTSAVIGQLCVETGMSRWWGAGAGLFCGEVLSLLRDLAEPYSVMWMALAAWFLFKRRPLLSAVALAAALLTREQLLLYVPLLALPLLAQRRRLTLLGSALVALGPFLGWQMFLHSVYGRWALLDSSASASLARVPFIGLWQERLRADSGLIVICVVLPLLAAFAIALAALWQHGPRSLLSDPLPVMVLLYCVLVSLTGIPEWEDMWAPGRLAAPGVVLAVLVGRRVSAQVGASYATLLAVTALSPLVLVLR